MKTLAKTNDVEAAEATEDAGTESTEGDVTDFQNSARSHIASNTTAAIATEASDYSRRSLENSSSFVAKLLGAKSFDSVIQIHLEYTRRLMSVTSRRRRK